MEKIVINRKVTTPKQEFITDCSISDVTESSVTITSKVELTKEQTWHIRRNIENNVLADQALSLISSSKDGDTYSYTFELPQRNPIYIEEVIEGETGETETYYILAFSAPHNILPEDLSTNSGMTLSFMLDDGTIQEITHIYSVFKDADAPIEDTTDYDPSRLNLYRLIVPLSENEWVTGSTYTNKAISFPYTEFFNDTDFWNRVSIVSYTDALVIPITLEKEYADGLLQEETVNNQFVDIVKEEVVPSVLNGEKVIVEPLLLLPTSPEHTQFREYEAQKMVFKLQFRQRDINGAIKEGKDWVNYSAGDDISTNENDYIPCHLSDLNFTDDDIAYQKEKLARSFLRLSLYDTKEFGQQQLLWYATIFMDTNKIYSQYAELAPQKDPDGPKSIASQIPIEFTITDRYDDTQSSEGFYIYTFPDVIEKHYSKETAAYLKVEFNHAGYGKTIPMGIPNHTEFSTDWATLRTTDIKDFFNNLYIPIIFDKENNKYYAPTDWTEDNVNYIFYSATEDGNGVLQYTLFETLLTR